MLTENRNANIDHLPAHQHLLDFLFQEYEEETDILLEELKLFCDEFPWEERVLTYCKLLLKRSEDDDLDDSFDSHDGGEPNKSENKGELYRTVCEITIKFLDYKMNKNNKLCWDLLAESLKFCTCPKEMRFMSANPWLAASFSDRGGWWVEMNFEKNTQTTTDILVKQAFVIACLYGSKHTKYKEILSVIEQNVGSSPPSTLSTLLKELEMSVKALTAPCLEPFQPDWSGVDRNWNKREWNKIKHIETATKSERNKSYYK